MGVLRLVLAIGITLFSLSAFSAGDSVTTKTYKELTEIQEIMGQGNIDEAYARLKELLKNVDDDSLDKALTLQTIGYVAMSNEKFEEAIGYLRESLALNKLPQNVVYNVGYIVAQLYAALGKFDEALTFAEGWFTQLEAPKPEQYIFMANIYAQTKRYTESIPYAEKAIAESAEPKEPWFQLLTANYFELKRFPEAAANLKTMVDRWPANPSYWEQLASVYVTIDDQASALAVLKIAFAENILEKESTVKSLVQLAIMQGIPEQGSRLLEAAFDKEFLPEDEEYLNMLAMALAAAKEREAAIKAYERVASVSETGDAWISISNIYVEIGDWGQAETALTKALDKDLEEPGKAWLLLGIAQAEQQKFQDARTSLRKSAAFEETETAANRWIKYAEDMKRQADWVAQYK